MKNLLKISLLGLIMSIALASCGGDGKKAPEAIDTAKVDSTSADGTRVKDDTTKADTVTKPAATKK